MISVATLGSHCALQLLKGAKDEGFKTILVCEKKREKLYRRFKFIDELIIVEKFSDILNQEIQDKLKQQDAILIPHGTLIAQMDSKQTEVSSRLADQQTVIQHLHNKVDTALTRLKAKT